MRVGHVVGKCSSCYGDVVVVETGQDHQPDLAQCDRCGREVGVSKPRPKAEPVATSAAKERDPVPEPAQRGLGEDDIPF